MKASEIDSAIRHLDKALAKIASMLRDMRSGVITYETPSKLEEAWYQLNCCRIYTEKEVTIEGYIQSSMGNINDAKEMLDSLIAWKKGLTEYGRLSILVALNEAISGIKLVRAELSAWLTGTTTGVLSTVIG